MHRGNKQAFINSTIR